MVSKEEESSPVFPLIAASISLPFALAVSSLIICFISLFTLYICSMVAIWLSVKGLPLATEYSIDCAPSPILLTNEVMFSVSCPLRGSLSITVSAISLSIAISERRRTWSFLEFATLALERLVSRLSMIELSS